LAANRFAVIDGNTGGLGIGTTNASGDIVLFTGGPATANEVVRVLSTGGVRVIKYDGAARGVEIGGSTSAGSGNFIKSYGTTAPFYIRNSSDVNNVTILSAGNVGYLTNNPLTLQHQVKWSADAVGTYHTFSKSRSVTQETHTIVQDNDIIGGLNFSPSDGTDFGTISAQIKSSVDDTSPGASSIGGDLIFSTAKGAGTDDLTLALTINKDQKSTFSGDVVGNKKVAAVDSLCIGKFRFIIRLDTLCSITATDTLRIHPSR